MEITQVLILLLHPIAALVVIREFARQRNWRKLSTTFKGSERAAELENHETQGKTSAEKKGGKSFAKSKQLHGKLSDIMVGLIAIHAFLGFLYLLQLIG